MHDHPSTPGPARSGSRVRSAVVALTLGAALFTAGAIGLAPDGSTTARSGPHTAPARGSLGALQARVRKTPKDADAWAALGMSYVQQARTTADPATYERAEKALRRSLAVRRDDNTGAQIGMGALAAARHDFPTALDWARRATTTDPYSSVAQGVLADAYTQLGRYPASYRAVQRMNDLRPDAPALARASYTFELRGRTDEAAALMRRSLDAASTTGERSFAHSVLSGLALQTGDTRGALREAETGLRNAPGDSALLEARARPGGPRADTAGRRRLPCRDRRRPAPALPPRTRRTRAVAGAPGTGRGPVRRPARAGDRPPDRPHPRRHGRDPLRSRPRQPRTRRRDGSGGPEDTAVHRGARRVRLGPAPGGP
ncbi:hypothetical protein OHB33_23955 [Streptomyces sp. NBC_01558]|uniref:tetratricopeptide repeat protein n=1 Tax=Streptomyces sp. NBC_01558 TaxID=2975878 RepID=UPI002DDC715B|nr:hypothetical protein [Streptomyces sp. NBC_01558]WSD79124.1 hypothetical protein OHB33_23955 [Streptomyces sp. NBC_01558]